MVPSVPPAPTAPVLGQGSFGAAPRAPAISGGPGSMAAPPARLPSQPAARAANDDDSSDSDDDEEGLSSIRIKIFTPINVRGDGNLIAMDTAITATKIAQGVTDALFSMTYGDAQGIPMIDEDGRPRPIRVVVSAPLTVLGSKNLMGERAVMERIAPGLRDYPASAMTKASLTEIGESASVKKRERSEVEEHEEGESKRTRRD
ncbi:uncharacterized protein RCO7_06804 [Rhynchosporium graminicola]|uniref:Uncharacterized protein n=1 Tax=Rhynchosporium graminicola TaxID=2792576 RepID=A0A1E1JXW1_9HELO|nr:uncharacterized protein RCO7_06804 [Rhynchosporium commune]